MPSFAQGESTNELASSEFSAEVVSEALLFAGCRQEEPDYEDQQENVSPSLPPLNRKYTPGERIPVRYRRARVAFASEEAVQKILKVNAQAWKLEKCVVFGGGVGLGCVFGGGVVPLCSTGAHSRRNGVL